jgi:hypothetical protein
MKKILLFSLLFSLNFCYQAQNFGNEWINYDQSYYDFKVYKEGIYRIDYQTLANSGINTNLFSSANMQLFGREKEQAIFVVDGGDNNFGPGDYFLFYANKNDGWLDSTLYEDPNTIGNPSYSLFNDTIHYFFTWNNSTNNKRFVYENDNSFSNYTPAPFILVKSENTQTVYYNDAQIQNGIKLSVYTPGEGYCSGMMDGGGSTAGVNFPLYFNTPHVYTGSGAPQAFFHGKSNSNSNASAANPPYNHHLRWTIGLFEHVLVDTIFGGYKQIITNKNIPLPNLTSGTTVSNFRIVNDLEALTDYQTFSYASLTYPRLTNFSGVNFDKFFIKNDPFSSKVRLDISNTSINSPILITLGQTPRFVVPTANGAGNWQALVPNDASVNQFAILADASLIINMSDTLKAINGNGLFTNFNEFSYDSVNLMVYHPSLITSSTAYKDYRSSTDGGSYNVVMANIEELYMQFGGGIEKHNASIRRFAHFAYTKAERKPAALTILGKGYKSFISRAYTDVFKINLIPSFGHPGSDICYTSQLEGSGYAPLIPTGRISATKDEVLMDYLNKLKDYENQQDTTHVYDTPNKDWQKQILHFSGGSHTNEQNKFFAYMNSFKSIIENAYFAGNVTTFRKVSSDPLDPSLLNKLSNELKNGVSLMTFFGHSSAVGFDISVDDPSNWENEGKYPVVIGNGCYSGDMYGGTTSFGEKLVNSPNRGAIAFLASSGLEYDNVAFTYCNELYNQFSPTSYGLPISHQIKKTIESLQSQSNNVPIEYLKSTFGATNLNGDPLLKLNWHTKPEIEITNQSLYFQPTDVNLTIDSIDVVLVIKNLGISVTDTFYVEITRRFPNSDMDSVYKIQYTSLHYVDTLKLKIPLQANIGIGINNITALVDLPESLIEEQYEEVTNNGTEKVLFLKLDAIQPIYPYEFAVIPRDTVTVKASTTNPIGGMKTYRFELDTTDLFDSPIKRHYTFSALGGIKEVHHSQWLNESGQSFPLICQDSTVYFWRTAIDSSELIWSESSFQYIKGKEGWGQDHFFQFKNNSFSNVTYDRINRKRGFEPIEKTLRIDVFDKIANIEETAYYIDNQRQDYGMCWLDPSIHLAVIDPISLKPWFTINNPETDTHEGHDLLNINQYSACRPRQEKYFIYRQNLEGLTNLNTILNSDIIPDGHYVVLYSVNYTDYSFWDENIPSLYDAFSNLGSNLIQPGLSENCFAFFTQKGFPEKTIEKIATVDGEKLTIETTINSGDYLGTETSKFIGPSSEWKTIYWKQDPSEPSIGDTTQLEISLFNVYGGLVSHIETIFTRNDSIVDLSNLIDAKKYPYIKLTAVYNDKVTFTPAQNDRWHVLYTPVPEAAIDGSMGYTWLPKVDTLNEGQNFSFAVDIKNISDYPMDSLLVNYWVEDQKHFKHVIPYERQDSLRVLQKMRDTITFSTTGLPGINSLWMEINPYINGTLVKDQLEQYHFNNLLQVPFYVKGDDVNPILDVTFNGRHILNGDIIDPESEIYITLKDDNPYLVMNDISDTTLFGIFLTYPDGTQRRIPFLDGSGNTVLQWYPAESQYKKFKIIYPALFEEDGVYTLLVQGSDRSGNLSGDLDYKISFEVIHESSITYLMNYPNPFSTSTRFVFTLTGSEVPDEIIIQIMTVTGKVVREITEDQLGPIHIGRNITEYAWDGTDEFGDRLANGVYLYRVLSQIKGEDIKHRETDGDIYFKKEFGKMYLMR